MIAVELAVAIEVTRTSTTTAVVLIAGAMICAFGLRRPDAVVTVGVPALILLPQDWPGLPTETRPAVVGILVIAALSCVAPREQRVAVPKVTLVAVALFLAVIVFSWLRTSNPGGTTTVLTVACLTVGIVLTLAQRLTTPSAIKSLMAAVTVVAVVLSCLALVEFIRGDWLFGGDLIHHAPLRGGRIRVQGIAQHPLVLAMVLQLALPLLLSRLVSGARNLKVTLSALIVGLAMVLTFARGSWLGLGVSVGVMTLILRGGVSMRIVRTIAIVGVLLFLSPLRSGVVDSVTSLVDPGSDEAAGSVAYRQVLQGQVVDFSLANPLGAGPAGSQTLHLRANVRGVSRDLSQSIDNTYALVAVEYGWAGLLALLLLLAAVLQHSVRAALTYRRHANGPLLAAIAGVHVGFVVTMYGVATLTTWPQVIVAFWAVTILGVAVSRQSASSKAEWADAVPVQTG